MPTLLDRISVYDGSVSFAETIGRGDRVAIVGLGPGGIDCARHLLDCCQLSHSIDLFSRHGRISKVQWRHAPRGHHDAEIERIIQDFERQGRVTLMQVFRAFAPLFRAADPVCDFATLRRIPTDTLAVLRRDIADAQANGPAYRDVLEGIGARMPRLWRCLPLSERKRLPRRLLRLFYVFRHAMPIETAGWLADRLDAGILRVGRLMQPISIRLRRFEASLLLLPGGRTVATYDQLVIATGPEWRLTEGRSPLIQQMLSEGWGVADPFGGFETGNFELTTVENVFAIGGLVRGEDFAVHSVPALVRHSRAIESTIRRRLVKPD